MDCIVCGVKVLPWERPQPMTFGGRRYSVPALCDRCQRANQYRPGSPEALDRLVTGEIDPEERARVRAASLLPWESE